MMLNFDLLAFQYWISAVTIALQSADQNQEESQATVSIHNTFHVTFPICPDFSESSLPSFIFLIFNSPLIVRNTMVVFCLDFPHHYVLPEGWNSHRQYSKFTWKPDPRSFGTCCFPLQYGFVWEQRTPKAHGLFFRCYALDIPICSHTQISNYIPVNC